MAEDVSEHEFLSSTVKQFHSKLREEVKASCKDVATVWREHLADRSSLQQYSTAMYSLAKGPWAKHGSGRVKWCADACDEYFSHGTLGKLLLKDLRRLEHSMPTLVPLGLLPVSPEEVEVVVEGFKMRKWHMLDVGSCYNPFTEYCQFEVTAIDIAPAVESVRECDFLSVEFVHPNEADPSLNGTDTRVLTDPSICEAQEQAAAKQSPPTVRQLPIGSYDVVVFSLLLSYMPSTEQRLLCCVNAHKALRLHGLLLIITPDSSHQNKHTEMMKSWKHCIEELGFHRWRYIKATHLHCMAFRKVQICVHYALVSSNHPMLYIPQDFQDTEVSQSHTCASQEKGSEEHSLTDDGFQILPFAKN